MLTEAYLIAPELGTNGLTSAPGRRDDAAAWHTRQL